MSSSHEKYQDDQDKVMSENGDVVLDIKTLSKGHINNPMTGYYLQHPSGIEPRQITDYMCFNLGCVVKYVMRCDFKHPDPIPDLIKARDYINFEIEKLERGK